MAVLRSPAGPGDMIVSFSDGVLDLYDGTLSAIDEIGRLAVASTSAKEIVDAVRDRAKGSANPDDVTILAVRRDLRHPGDPSSGGAIGTRASVGSEVEPFSLPTPSHQGRPVVLQ